MGRELRPKRELLTLLRRLNDCVGVSARHVYTQQITVSELLQCSQSDIRRQLPELCAFMDSLLSSINSPSATSPPSSLIRRAFRHPDAQWLSRSARESGISALVCQQLVRLARRGKQTKDATNWSTTELTIYVLLDALLSSCAQRLGQSPDACKWRPTQPKPRFHAMTCFPVWTALLPFAALMGLRFPDTFLQALKEYRVSQKKTHQVNCDFAQVSGVWRLVGELNRGDSEKQSEVTRVMTELLALTSDKLLDGLVTEQDDKRMEFHLYDQLLDKFFTGLQEFSFTSWRANAVLKPALLDALKNSLKVPEDRTKEFVVPQRVVVFTAAGSMLVKDLAPDVVAMVLERVTETAVLRKNPLLKFLVGFCAHVDLVPLKSVMALLELLLEAYKTLQSAGSDAERRELVFYIVYVALHRCDSVDRLRQEVSSEAAEIKKMLSQLQMRLCSDIAFEDLYVAAPVHWTATLWKHWVFLSDEQAQCFVSEAEENDNDTEAEFKDRVEGWHTLQARVTFKPASFSSFTQMKALLKPHLIASVPLTDEQESVAPARKRRRTGQEPVDPAQLERSFDVLLLPDVMERVCSFMSAKRLCRMALVCRTFADISHRASLWKPLYMRVGIPVGKKQNALPPAPVTCQHGEIYEHNWRQMYQERSKVMRRLRRMQLRATKAMELSELDSETPSSSRPKPFVPLICSYCGCDQVLKSDSEVEAHQKLHKRFTCTETSCRASFLGLHKFNAHMKEHPAANSRLECGFDGCEKTYTSAKWLANHRQKEGHHLDDTSLPSHRPVVNYSPMAQAGDSDSGPLPTLAASALAAKDSNEDKTAALVATCSFMLSLATGLRLLGFYLAKTRRRRKRLRLLPGLDVFVPFPVALHALDVSVFVVLWYAVSIGMTLFNKWFLRVWAGGGYPFATTMTCINMFVKCLLSRVIDRCSSGGCTGNGTMVALPSSIYWKLAVPIGVCTALDIMLSNLSLFYITVTFYTIVKSGGNVWNLLFSICLGHQRPSWPLFGVIVLISSGIGLASYGSAQFVFYGFVLVLAASVIGTLRWVLTQSLLQAMEDSNAAPRNKVLAVVYYVSPASAIGLLPIALFSEGSDYATSRFLLDSQLLMMSLVFIFISGCLAFVLIFIEILLVKKTSALSLGIAGSFKDVTQVLLAVFIFGDQLIPINVFGLVVATCGMLVYTFIKHMTAEAAGDGRSSKLKGYQRVPTSNADLEGGSDVQSPGNSERKDDRVPEFHMKDERGASASGTKTLNSVSRVELVRRESKEYFNSTGISSASHV